MLAPLQPVLSRGGTGGRRCGPLHTRCVPTAKHSCEIRRMLPVASTAALSGAQGKAFLGTVVAIGKRSLPGAAIERIGGKRTNPAKNELGGCQ